ncbi:MAG: hypothetical protein WCJ66_00525 [Verrucomicrobiota bacterium]
MKTILALLAGTVTFAAASTVQEVAHYNLKGAGGVRDTAAPEVWTSFAPRGPDLARRGSPKVMSDGPRCRRLASDSSIKFEEPDLCYSVAKNLVEVKSE